MRTNISEFYYSTIIVYVMCSFVLNRFVCSLNAYNLLNASPICARYSSDELNASICILYKIIGIIHSLSFSM